MAGDRLRIYNRALVHLGERRLANLSEEREPRRVLDEIWGDTVAHCLEQGYWNFAIRSVEFANDPSVEPAFGYAFAFDKPDDWVRTAALSGSEYFDPPLRRYQDEGGYWWADITPIYVRYVSNGTAFGLDLGKWPQTFCEYVAVRLAMLSCDALTQSASKFERLEKLEKRARIDARSKDAMNEANVPTPHGAWVLARVNSINVRRYDRA